MKIRSKEYRSLLKKYYGFYEHISISQRLAYCHGCGKKIHLDTPYLSFFVYKSLWYKFHVSTMCRFKALIAIEGLYEPESVEAITKKEILQRVKYMIKNNYIFLYQFLTKKEVEFFIKQMEEKK